MKIELSFFGAVSSPPTDEFLDGDRQDIMLTPVDNVCMKLGRMGATNAIPALVSVLERRPETDWAVHALGGIGDPGAIPALLELLESGTAYDDAAVIVALGKLKAEEAVPLLASRLGSKKSEAESIYTGEARKTLEALLAIGDVRAVEPIRGYIRNVKSEEHRRIARRVLIQLDSKDAVADLIKLFDSSPDDWERSRIIRGLSTYDDDRVVRKLEAIAMGSKYAMDRRDAIMGLGVLGSDFATQTLRALLKVDFPQDLIADRCWWKGAPPDFEEYYRELIQEQLLLIEE